MMSLEIMKDFTADNRDARSRFEKVRISDLKVDPSYQRQLTPSGESQIQSIVAHFDERALGSIIVSVRDSSGDKYIIDGHHRVQAARRVGLKYMDAIVMRGLSRSQEAELFLRHNQRSAVGVSNKLKARMTMNEPQAMAIKDVCASSGFELTPNTSSNPRSVKCIVVLDRIYERSGALRISEILNIVSGTWPSEKNATHGIMVDGINRFLDAYPEIGHTALIDKWSKYSAHEVMQRAKGLKAQLGGTPGMSVARSLLQYYNEGRRSGKVENRLIK